MHNYYITRNRPVYDYAFDDIGNRTSTGIGGDTSRANLRTASYGANNLNQYTNRTVPMYLEITGSAASAATVTVNGNSTYRKDEYFWKELSADNSSSALWQPITNVAVLPPGPNGTIIGNNFLVETPEAFSYDADGNLTQDGRWTYTWDAENRLLNMTSLSSAPAGSKLKLDFAYDYYGRRVQKLVSTNNGSYVPAYTNRFVYDGWNLQAILNPQSSVTQSFLWGLDLSGSLQGAGGVGGLLAISSPGSSQFTCFDGNGNIMALADTTSSAVTAQYEYGPFGEPIRLTGSAASANPLRFSTKYADAETDYLYYGYRFYNASSGRWLSRDTQAENGGLNLYAMLENNSVDSIDFLGFGGAFVAGPMQAVGMQVTDSHLGHGNNRIALEVGIVRETKKTIYTQFVTGDGWKSTPAPVDQAVPPVATSYGQYAWVVAEPTGRSFAYHRFPSEGGPLADPNYGNETWEPIPLRYLIEQQQRLQAIELLLTGAMLVDGAGVAMEGMGLEIGSRCVAEGATSGLARYGILGDYLAAEETGALTYNEMRQSGLSLTDRMTGNQFRKLVESIKQNGLQDNVINFVKIDDENFIVLGNNRVLAAQRLGITDQLLFKEVQLPFRGFKTENHVLSGAAEFMRGH